MPWTERHLSMDPKILRLLYACLLLQGLRAQSATPGTRPVNLNVTVPPASTGIRTDKTSVTSGPPPLNVTIVTSSGIRTDKTSVTSGPPPLNVTIVASSALTSQSTSTAKPSTTQMTSSSPSKRLPTKRTQVAWDDKWNAPFTYDYGSLRVAGLSVAAVLFILGIMIITCGKIARIPRCHVSKGKSYQVTRN